MVHDMPPTAHAMSQAALPRLQGRCGVKMAMTVPLGCRFLGHVGRLQISLDVRSGSRRGRSVIMVRRQHPMIGSMVMGWRSDRDGSVVVLGMVMGGGRLEILPPTAGDTQNRPQTNPYSKTAHSTAGRCTHPSPLPVQSEKHQGAFDWCARLAPREFR